MKKIMMTALALGVAVAGITIGTTAQASIVNKDALKCENMRCTFCKGTGFQGNFNCIHCKGTGRINSY